MSYSKLILRDSAEIVWPLDDITESSSVSQAINFFTKNPNSYSASINPANTTLLYNPIVFGGGTALSFTSSAIGLSIPALGRFSELYDNKESAISFWFQSNKLFNEEYPIFKKRGHSNIGLFIKHNYLIFKYGTSSSYFQTAVDLIKIKEPNHILLSKTNSGLSISLNGVPVNSFENIVKLEKDLQHQDNDYFDFYGPPEGSWNIDSIAYYPNNLDPNTIKRHYVYGLGKTVSDTIFYSRGGNLYNMSTLSTEKIIDINWEYKNEWALNDLINLSLTNDGIKPIKYSSPVIYSIDNLINKNNNSISFNLSASNTQASYIQIDKLNNKIKSNEPVFLKIKLNGELPDEYLKQRILSYGQLPNNEILTFDLFNDSGTYKIKINAINSSSVSFTISNPTASPSIYIGMMFSDSTILYFAESGSIVQSTSFPFISASGYGTDPLVPYFPPKNDMYLRIGSPLNYEPKSFIGPVYDVEQFYGSFEKFMVMQDNFSTASVNYSYLESYRKSRYGFSFLSNENRFKINTYGYGNFIVHSAAFGEYVDDLTQKTGANVINFGYPETQSSSQVYFYVTHLNYSGSVIYPKTEINDTSYLNFINNKNINQTYLKFDFEIYAEDSNYYPPKIKYFQMQTFKSIDNKTVLRDEGGPNYVLYPSSSIVYLPDIRYTPTIFMTEDSGLKLKNTQVDFTENVSSTPLDPTIINGIKLWLDARFTENLSRPSLNDDSKIFSWSDLSNNNNAAIQNISASAPVYRVQTSNILRINQLNGSEFEDLSFINSINSSIESSAQGAFKGIRSIKIIPNKTSIDSYIDLSFNTASFSTYPNQSYNVVGTIKLDKPQTGSALHLNARKIIIHNVDNGVETFAASSNASTNLPGFYSLSATFSTNSSTTRSIFRFYNGSFSEKDIVYWDCLGVYPIISASPIYSWITPLTNKDRPSVKFKDKGMNLISSASVNHPSSLYIVARSFGDSIFIQSTSSSIFYSNSSSYFSSYGSPQSFCISDNQFHVFSIINNGSTTELFLDGFSYGAKNIGSLNIDKLIIGQGMNGEISSILLYEGIHNSTERKRIENWLMESFLVS